MCVLPKGGKTLIIILELVNKKRKKLRRNIGLRNVKLKQINKAREVTDMWLYLMCSNFSVIILFFWDKLYFKISGQCLKISKLNPKNLKFL